jgi:putative redox protein
MNQNTIIKSPYKSDEMAKVQRFNFKNQKGIELSGRIDLPLALKPKAYAIFAHCFTCNKNFKAVKQISHALTQEGFAVLSFDFTGLGSSEGEFSDTNFSSNVADLVSAANYLQKTYAAPSLLVGHSLGGAAVLFAARQIPSVQAVATIGSPGEVNHVKHLFAHEMEKIREVGYAEVQVGPKKVEITEQFVDDLNSADLLEEAENLDKALLILHSPQDLVVPVEEAAKLYHAAKHPKSFVSLDGADHILKRAEDGQYVGRVIASWANRYIDFFEENHKEVASQVCVRLHDEDIYTCDIRARQHKFLGDEPEMAGGADEGPTPYELLQAALGSCTAITLEMYARRKKWPLEQVHVQLNYDRRHCRDSEDCEDPRAFIHSFEIVLTLEGDLTDEQKQRLVQIAHKCPVHRTLIQQKEMLVTLSS